MEEHITLYVPGSIPGIPGEHAPGVYLVDYVARTIRPLSEPEAPTPATEETTMPEEAQPASTEPPPVLTKIAAEVTQLEQELQHIEQPE